jgi:hypothetical protein
MVSAHWPSDFSFNFMTTWFSLICCFLIHQRHLALTRAQALTPRTFPLHLSQAHEQQRLPWRNACSSATSAFKICKVRIKDENVDLPWLESSTHRTHGSEV